MVIRSNPATSSLVPPVVVRRAALRSSGASLDAACGTTADAGDSLERLRRGEVLLQAAHRALVKLRPRYADFVAVLDPAQRARLEAWLDPGHAAFRRAEG